jgi:hypothetical protein
MYTVSQNLSRIEYFFVYFTSLSACELYSIEWETDWWMANLRGFGRKWLWPNQYTRITSACTCIDWRNAEKIPGIISCIPTEIRKAYLPNNSLELHFCVTPMGLKDNVRNSYTDVCSVDLDKKQRNSRMLYIITRLRPRASFRVYTLGVRVVTLTWLLRQLNLHRNLEHKIFQHNSSLFLAIFKSGLSLKPHKHTPHCSTV